MLRVISVRRFASHLAPAGKKAPSNVDFSVKKYNSTFSNTAYIFAFAGAVVAAVGTYTFLSSKSKSAVTDHSHANAEDRTELVKHAVQDKIEAAAPSAVNYSAVAKDVAELMESNADYDEGQGSYGPLLVRLAWHASGTYDVVTKTGGSDGATMRFSPESGHGANAGLGIARDLLESVKQKYGDALSYSDLWTLAGCVAIQRRKDKTETACTPDGRLPDASKSQDHLRDIFYRMSFNDREIVALSGAHALGRCHVDRSGFKGPWSNSPTTFSNAYYTELLGQHWQPKTTEKLVTEDGKSKTVAWKGPMQFEDAKTKSLMMLPSDMALTADIKFRPIVEEYAKDSDVFFKDFSAAFERLIHLGVNEQCAKSVPVSLAV